MNQALAVAAIAVMSKNEQGSAEYEVAAYALNSAMGSGHLEQLGQLVRTGPIFDGDVISKNARDDLISWGLATRVCVKGEQGFAAANYRGWDVLRAGDW